MYCAISCVSINSAADDPLVKGNGSRQTFLMSIRNMKKTACRVKPAAPSITRLAGVGY
jgi:hypothetical protein